MTASWICLPPGRCQFNGTETLAHCNCLPNFLSQLFQAIPPCLPAAAAAAPDPAAPAGELVTPLPWLPSAGVVALAGDADGSAAATTPQIAISMSGTLRILSPRAWDARSPKHWPVLDQLSAQPWPMSTNPDN